MQPERVVFEQRRFKDAIISHRYSRELFSARESHSFSAQNPRNGGAGKVVVDVRDARCRYEFCLSKRGGETGAQERFDNTEERCIPIDR
jgi:hypothetical protein